jgi:hypothetical protein
VDDLGRFVLHGAIRWSDHRRYEPRLFTRNVGPILDVDQRPRPTLKERVLAPGALQKHLAKGARTREVVRGLRRLAIIANVGNPGASTEMREIRDAARTMGLDTVLLEIRRPEDITPAIEAVGGRVEALYVCGGAPLTTYRVRLHTLTLVARRDVCFSRIATFAGLLRLTRCATDWHDGEDRH